jgi:predicted phosphohydrolase
LKSCELKRKNTVITMSTTFQIASDLHIEFKNDAIPDPRTMINPVADVLILAGDIGSLYKYDQLKGFLALLCPSFEAVLYVPGNHEFYTIEDYPSVGMAALFKRLKTLQAVIPNLFILNKNSVTIGDICIAGCTLWSEPTIKIPRYIVRLENTSDEKYKNMFKTDVKYIKNMVTYCKDNSLKLVVVTHHCPTYRVLENSSRRTKFASLYASDLDSMLVKDDIDTWVCGHVHDNFDFEADNGTRVVGNQKGKPKDRIPDFSTEFTIEV